MLQDLAGVRGARSRRGETGGRAGQASAAKANGNGHAAKANGESTDSPSARGSSTTTAATGSAGVIESLEPAVVKLEDSSIIRTSLDVLLAGAAEGIIVRTVAVTCIA